MKSSSNCLGFSFVIIFLLLGFNAHSVDKRFIDSLENVIKTTKDQKTRFKCLYSLSFEYGLFNPKKGIEVGNILLKEANEAKDSLMIYCAYNGISNSYETMMLFDSSLILNERAIELYKNSNKYNLLFPTYCNIAHCHKKLGHYDLAIEYYKRAEICMALIKDKNPRFFCLVSDLYLRVNHVDKAKAYILEGINTKYLDNNISPILYSSLGYCFAKSSNFDSAFYYLHKSIQELLQHTDIVAYAVTLDFMADAQLQYGRYDSAMYYYNQSMTMYNKLYNSPSENHIHIKYLYTKTLKGNKNSILLGDELKSTTEKLNNYGSNYDLLLDSYSFLSKAYENINEHKLALKYLKLSDSLSQTILNREKRLLFLEYEKSFETLKRDNKIIELKNINKIKELEIINNKDRIKRYTLIIVLVSIIFIMISIFLWVLFNKKRALLKAQHELNLKTFKQKERSRLSLDLHDDIGSGLNKIFFLGEMIMNQHENSSKTYNLADKIKETTKKLISNMRDLIWVLDEDNNNIGTLLSQLRGYSFDYLEDKDIELSFNIRNDNSFDHISKETERCIIAIVKEILSNILKHSEATKVSIDFTVSNNNLIISIADNGIGFKDNLTYGYGIKNMQKRAKEINAAIEIESNNGKGTKIIFRKNMNSDNNTELN